MTPMILSAQWSRRSGWSSLSPATPPLDLCLPQDVIYYGVIINLSQVLILILIDDSWNIYT